MPKDDEDNPELGRWAGAQRRNYKKFSGEEESTSETIKARVQKLNEIRFDWGATRSKAPWEKQYVSVILI
jgi:hypothetical protein